MFRCALAALVTVSLVAPAAAQSRAFPQNTLRGAIVFRDDGQVLLNGQVVPLSPGSRVRDQRNMIVLAASLVGANHLVCGHVPNRNSMKDCSVFTKVIPAARSGW